MNKKNKVCGNEVTFSWREVNKVFTTRALPETPSKIGQHRDSLVAYKER